MNTAHSAWVRLGNSGITAATRALLAWWLPFLIVPGLLFSLAMFIMGGPYGSLLLGWTLWLIAITVTIAFVWSCWHYRPLRINPETGQFRRGRGSVITASQISFAVTIAKNPEHPVVLFGNDHWRVRLRTSSKITGTLSAGDYQLLVETLETAYFVQDYTARSLVGDGIRMPTRVRKRETLVSDFLGLERISYDSAGYIRLLNLLQREAAAPELSENTPGKHRRRLGLQRQTPHRSTNVPTTPTRTGPRLDTLRYLLSSENRNEQRNLIAWLRGNGNFVYLGRSTVQIIGSTLLFFLVVGYPFITFWLYVLAYDRRMYWLEEIIVGFTVVGTLLMMFVIHPAFMLIRLGLINRYQTVHSAVAAELHQRAIDQEMVAGLHDDEEAAQEVTLAKALPNNFGSLEYFLKPNELLREKVKGESSDTRLAAPARQTPRSARPESADRPALIREVLAIIDREQPVSRWREKYYGSVMVFGIVWIIALIVFWIIGFIMPWGSKYDLWLTVFMAPTVLLTAATVKAWAMLARYGYNTLRWEHAVREERGWLLKKIREGQQGS